MISLDTQDGTIKLIEFASESEYWTFVQKFNRCIEMISMSDASGGAGIHTTVANGTCVFSSNESNSAEPHVTSGEAYKWSLESNILKVTDNRGK